MPAVYGSTSVELGSEESIICVNLHSDLDVKYTCTNLKCMCNLLSYPFNSNFLYMAASKQARTLQTHFRNAVPLVWSLLRLTPITVAFVPSQPPRDRGKQRSGNKTLINCGFHYDKMIQCSSSFGSTVCCHLPLDSLIPWPYVRVSHHVSERVQPLNGTQHTIHSLQGRRERNNTVWDTIL